MCNCQYAACPEEHPKKDWGEMVEDKLSDYALAIETGAFDKADVFYEQLRSLQYDYAEEFNLKIGQRHSFADRLMALETLHCRKEDES